MRNVVVSAVCIVVTVLIALTVPTWVPSDVQTYMDMVNGLEVSEPFNTRVLVPWLVNVLGGTYEHFVMFNLILFAIALYIYASVYDLVTALAFVVGTFSVLQIVIQVPMLESAILLLIALALWVSKNGNGLWFVPLCVIAALTHPIAFAIVVVICLTSGSEGWLPLLYVLPGVLVMVLLWPAGYGELMLPIEIYKTILITIGVFWIGLLRVRRDRHGVLVLAVLVLTLGFSMIATWTAKLVYYNMLVLGPYLVGSNLED